MKIDNSLLEIASLPSPRLRTAPTVAHEEHNYSMHLRVYEMGSDATRRAIGGASG
jgi:hypothetical protein